MPRIRSEFLEPSTYTLTHLNRDAFKKHALRSDHRDGIRSHGPANIAEDEPDEESTKVLSRPLTKSSSRPSTEGSALAARYQLQRRMKAAEPELQKVRGFVDMDVPSFRGGKIRYRVSRTLQHNSPEDDEVLSMLQRQESITKECGADGVIKGKRVKPDRENLVDAEIHAHEESQMESPRGERKKQLNKMQLRTEPGSKTRVAAAISEEFEEPSCDLEASTWEFLQGPCATGQGPTRSLVEGTLSENKFLGELTGTKGTSKLDRFLQSEMLSGTATKEDEEAVRADLEDLLLTTQGCRLNINAIISSVPDVTSLRWRKMLRCKSADLGAKLRELMSFRPDIFKIVREMGEDDQMNYRVGIADRRVQGVVGEGMCLQFKRQMSLWVNIIPQLLTFQATANRLRKLWGVQFDPARVDTICQAVEKNYSQLAGRRAFTASKNAVDEAPLQSPSAAGSKRNSVVNVGADADSLGRVEPWASGARRPETQASPALGFRRGAPRGSFVTTVQNDKAHQAKFHQWISAVVLEDNVDAELEWGESVMRLASSINKNFKSQDATEDTSSRRASHRGSQTFREIRYVEVEGPDSISLEAFMAFCEYQGFFEGESTVAEDMTRKAFNQALQVQNAVIQEREQNSPHYHGQEPRLVKTCSPLLLTLLLHFLAHRRHTKYDPFVLELLWRQCGWGFPIARRCIRQLKAVYDNFSEQGALRPRRIRLMFQDAKLEPPSAAEFAQARCDGSAGAEMADLLQLLQQYAHNRRHATPLQVLMQVCEQLKE